MEIKRDPTFEVEFLELWCIAERVARRVAGAAAAEDIAAEVMSRTFAKWQRVKRLPHRRAWVARVAFNESLDAYRREKRRRGAEAMASREGVTGPDDATLRLVLNDRVSMLPKRQREVVGLRFLADFGEAETAKALGISIGSVKQHASRGLEALRRDVDLDELLGRKD